MRYWNGERNFTEKVIAASIIGALLSAVLAVSIDKFLYPNGTGDYFSHYFPYYKEVVRNGNIWPNELWYHFYISKGFGDVFFAIVLSDLLGPQAVSQAMFILSLIIAYAMDEKNIRAIESPDLRRPLLSQRDLFGPSRQKSDLRTGRNFPNNT